MATSYVNSCVFSPASNGTVDFVVSAALTGWQTPASAGAVDGATYRYRASAVDNSQWEDGTGTYTVSSTTLSRTTVKQNHLGTTAKVAFTLPPVVTISFFDDDLTAMKANNGLIANSSGTFVNANNGLIANTTGVYVLANTGITANTTGTFVNTTVIAPLASPSFTGTPLAPTATSGTKNTQIATTAYVSGGTVTFEPGILYNTSIAFSVATNALTAAMKQFDGSTDPTAGAPNVVAMRSATSSSGTFNLRTATAAYSLVIPSGATIGHTSAVAGNLHWYLIDNSGTLEVAVAGSDLGSSGIVTTVAITSGATSATIMYSTTLRTSVPFRKIAVTIDTQTTAGTWTAVPSTVNINPQAMISDTSYLANSGLSSNSSGHFVLANNGISANSTGTYAVGANGTIITAAGINVLGNNGILANTTGTWVVGANGVTITSTGVNVAANTGLVANTTGVWLDTTKVVQPATTTTISVGYTLTSFNAGTLNSGTFTPAPASGNYQFAASNGAFTFAAPASDCAIDILLTNGTAAGAITFSGYTVSSSTGDALTTTSTSKFIVSVRRINSVSTYIIKALQ